MGLQLGGSPLVGINYEDFPALFRAADSNSLAGQRSFLFTTKISLGALVVAAAFGMVSVDGWPARVIGGFATVAFAAALITEVYRLKEQPDRDWYLGRAVAESAKTLTWRFMVGGAPFGINGQDTNDATRLLLARFKEIDRDVRPTWLVPDEGSPEQVTEVMRRTRALPLAERQAMYLRERIEDQRSWYARKSRWNSRRSTQWSVALAVLEMVGLVAGVARAAGLVDVDLLGLTAAIVAAGAAWAQSKQHQNLATAYAVASHELATIAVRAGGISDEQDWAIFVADAEEAISREHTLWRASHVGY
jgi:hypothetical protein